LTFECQALITMADIKQKYKSKIFFKCVVFISKILQKFRIFPKWALWMRLLSTFKIVYTLDVTNENVQVIVSFQFITTIIFKITCVTAKSNFRMTTCFRTFGKGGWNHQGRCNLACSRCWLLFEGKTLTFYLKKTCCKAIKRFKNL
jgi:hypothetical protein